MGSDGAFPSSKRKTSGISPPRKWSSPLLSEEVSLQTLAGTTYVRLTHPDDVMSMGFEHDIVKHGTRWGWLKLRPGREVRRATLAKSRSQNAWATWLGRPPADEYQFDPTKRWPQGW